MLTGRRQSTRAGDRIRVLVVDDSVVIRNLVPRALKIEPSLEVVGTAAHGRIALAKIPHVNPDVITLDVEMPEMDGLETLRRIREQYPDLCVIMFSSLTRTGAEATLDALSLGANDYVAKPTGERGLEESLAALRGELVPKIKQFFLENQPIGVSPSPAARWPRPAAPPVRRQFVCQLVAIGVSTGGPAALSSIIPKFPADFPAPILIVQHMPAVFTRLLAERLQKLTTLHVEEAADGNLVNPGNVFIAPGGVHMCVRREGIRTRIVLDRSMPRNSCCPSVDVLFESVAAAYGDRVIGVVLTGMGQDGLRGTEKLKSGGAYVIAQDEASSVVWGMPGFVANAGLADAIVPLEEVVPEILKHTECRGEGCHGV